MKTIVIFLFIALGLSSVILAQQTQQGSPVPAAVLDAFKTKFPGIVAQGWAQDKDNNYSVSFKGDTSMLEAAFDAKGMWLSTSWEIQEVALPQPVVDALGKTDYIKWEKENVEKSKTPDYPLLYKVVFMKGKKQKQTATLYLLPDGKVVKKEEVK